ncbi:MAG: hypothetical protein FJ116_02085 [Deltaproteobacteria bacterium]|nr:hypothetical protein [Deltaproteobacteria bacterium]
MKRYYLLLILIGLSNSMVPTRAENYIQDPSGDYQSVGPTSPNTEAPQAPVSEGIQFFESVFGPIDDVLAEAQNLKACEACEKAFGNPPNEPKKSKKNKTCRFNIQCQTSYFVKGVKTNVFCQCGNPDPKNPDPNTDKWCLPVAVN